MTRRIAILTGGGDAPGLNAVIRAVVRTAILRYGWDVLGVRDGFDGFLYPDGIRPLGLEDVAGILPRGGTILGTVNVGKPLMRRTWQAGREVLEDLSPDILARARHLNLDAVLVVGGDGTLRAAAELMVKGLPVIGIPKTIDNDVYGTERTVGFATAVEIAAQALDRLHSTAESLHRVMVMELMGRHAGFLALHAGLAGGADVILIPEIPFHYDVVAEAIVRRARQGRPFSIVAVAEGAYPEGGAPVYQIPDDVRSSPRLGGIGGVVAAELQARTGFTCRWMALGYLQRGGPPNAADRMLATLFGVKAVELAAQGRTGVLVAWRAGRVEPFPLEETARHARRVQPETDPWVQAARAIGICLGDASF